MAVNTNKTKYARSIYVSFDLNIHCNFAVSQAPRVILNYSKTKTREKKTPQKSFFYIIARMLIRSTMAEYNVIFFFFLHKVLS